MQLENFYESSKIIFNQGYGRSCGHSLYGGLR